MAPQAISEDPDASESSECTGYSSDSTRQERLRMHKILGEGNFGQVWLVSEEHQGTTLPYALKIQSKFELASEGQIQAVCRETEIMKQLKHPFINKLVETYQDDDFCYMLMDSVQGGELSTVMLNATHSFGEVYELPESQAKFYALGIADALAYMHVEKIVFRDLKPENVMIDGRGYPVLIDFGFAKVVPDKTYTLYGTPNYMPPEVILQLGHSVSYDNWSLGVVIHELMTGATPFCRPGMDQMATFEAIVQHDYQDAPNGSAQVQDLIRSLLQKDPTQRLGSLHEGEDAITQHPWFADIDLQAMWRKEIQAPWVPDIKHSLDTSCFDDWSGILEDRTKMMYQRITQSKQALFAMF
jgi:serine/threonine protein kinase